MTVRMSTVDLVQRFDHKEKKFTYKTLVVAFKKESRLFTIITDFFQAWKIAGQIQDFFNNSKLCTNPVTSSVLNGCRNVSHCQQQCCLEPPPPGGSGSYFTLPLT